ncbi:MAG: ABC transporter substrate-binding protein [Anaerolineae bacterium]
MPRVGLRQCFAAVLLITVLLVPQAGCVLQTQSSGPVVLRISYYPEVVDLKPLLQIYMREHPGITIETFERDPSNFPSLLTEIQNGKMDIVRDYRSDMATQIRNGTFEPLEGYVESSDWGKIRGDYFNGTWEALQVNSQQYAIPASMDMYVAYANLDIFKNAGVEPPDESWTVDDLLTKANAVNQPEGAPGGNQPVAYGFGTFYMSVDPIIFTYLHGGAIVDSFDNPTVAYLDSPRTVEAVTFYTDLITKYKVSLKSSLIGAYFRSGGIASAEMQGYCALWFGLFSGRGASLDTGGILNKWPFTWKMLPLPQDEQAISMGDVDGYYIPVVSQYKHEALDLVRWLSDQPQAAGSRFPVRKSLAQDARFKTQVGDEPARIGALAAENLLTMPQFYGRRGSSSLRIFFTAINGILEKGDDPQSALENAQVTAMQQILAAQQGLEEETPER